MPRPSLRSTLASSTAHHAMQVLAGNGASAAAGFVTLVMVGRILGPDATGRFAIGIALAALVAELADLGLSMTVIKEVAEASARGDHRGARQAVAAALRLKLPLAVVAALGVGAFAPDSLAGAAPLVVGTALVAVGTSLLAALRAFDRHLVTCLTFAILRVGFTGLLAASSNLSASSALGAQALAAVVAGAVALGGLPPGFLSLERPTSSDTARLLRFSRWVLLNSALVQLLRRADLFLLAALSSTAAVGFYSVAERLAHILPLFAGALSTTLLPKVAALGDGSEVRAYLRRIVGATILPATGVLLLVGVGPWLVPAVFTDAYQSAVSPFMLLALAYGLDLILTPFATLVFGRGRPDLITAIITAQIAVHVVVASALIPDLGAAGAAFATLAARGAAAALMPSLVRSVADRSEVIT